MNRIAITDAQRQAVWKKHYPTAVTGTCRIDGRPITMRNFYVGHVCGTMGCVEDLVPICDVCNSTMGTAVVSRISF